MQATAFIDRVVGEYHIGLQDARNLIKNATGAIASYLNKAAPGSRPSAEVTTCMDIAMARGDIASSAVLCDAHSAWVAVNPAPARCCTNCRICIASGRN